MPEFILLGLCVAMVVCVWLGTLCSKLCAESPGFLSGVGFLVLGGMLDAISAFVLVGAVGFCMYQGKHTGQYAYYAFWVIAACLILAATFYYFRGRRAKVPQEDLRPNQL